MANWLARACNRIPPTPDIATASRRMAAWVVAGLAMASVYHGLLYALGCTYPWETFLFRPSDRFNDWISTVQTAITGAPYFSQWRGAYFPFAYILALAGDEETKAASVLVFEAISAGLMALAVVVFWTLNVPKDTRAGGSRIGILLFWLITAFASYPYVFGAERGNMDLWVGSLVLLYVATLNSRAHWIGALALGVATSMKGYPLAFILLGLSRRQFASSGLAIVSAILLSLFSLASFKGGLAVNWAGFRDAQRVFGEAYALGTTSMSHSSDPYNAIRAVTATAWQAWKDLNGIAGPSPLLPVKGHAMAVRGMVLSAYMLLSFGFAAISALFVLFSQAPAWRRVVVTVLIALLFPNVANDYKLLLLLPALFTVIIDQDPDPARHKAFWLLALPLVPNSYIYVYNFSLSMFLNPVFLVALWWIALGKRETWRRMISDFKSVVAYR